MTKTTLFRAGCAVLAWLVILTQFTKNLTADDAGTVAEETVALLSYFTIQTNILAAVVMSVSVLAPHSWAGRASVRGAVALYILIVAVVYHAVLAKLYNFTGLAFWLDQSFHTILPALFVFDWLLLTRKTGLKLKHALFWLAFPLVYLIYTLVRGHLVQTYPYPFLDLTTLSIGQVSVNIAGLVLVFFVGGVLNVLAFRPRGQAK